MEALTMVDGKVKLVSVGEIKFPLIIKVFCKVYLKEKTQFNKQSQNYTNETMCCTESLQLLLQLLCLGNTSTLHYALQ